MEAVTQKIIARRLDRAALRAETIGQWGATSKQCWYLAGLMLAAGEDASEYVTDTHLILTKHRASIEIDALLRQTKQAA